MASGSRRKTSPATIERAVRDTEIWQARVDGLTQQQIADRHGITVGRVSQILTEMLAKRQAEGADALRAVEVDKLDQAEQAVLAVLRNRHLHIAASGKIVRDDTGEPVVDDAPVLQATDRLLRIAERRAKLMGLDAPSQSQVDLGGRVTYEVVGVDLSKLT